MIKQETVFLLLALTIFIALCSAEDESYVASVVEHVPVMATSPGVTREEAQLVMQENLDRYEEHIVRAQLTALAQGRPLQLIVFPEDGLYGAAFYSRKSIQPYLEPIPEPVPLSSGPSSTATPCDFPDEQAAQSPALVRASCMARSANVTIVLNMGEVLPCSGDENCPDDGHYQYNTQIALAESGQLIGKYHKSHLYYEPQFDEPRPPEIRYFDTSFGVRFGMMICFDVMFQLPQLALYDLGIRDFTWTSWWVNFPALITGTQTEVARSSQLPSNFLASGIGLSWYNSGSGIFSEGQPLRSWYNPTSEPKSHVLVAEVPYLVPPHSLEEETRATPLDMMEDISMRDSAAFELLLNSTDCDGLCCGCGQEIMEVVTFSATTGLSETVVATSRSLTCAVTVEIEQESSSGPEEYGVVALTGMYNNLFPAQICALVHCGGDDCEGFSLSADTQFASWSIHANVTSSDLFVMYPLVAEDLARIPPPSAYEYSGLSTDTPSLVSTSGKATMLLNAALFGLNHHIHMPNTTQTLTASSFAGLG